jgi:hypothetical protein
LKKNSKALKACNINQQPQKIPGRFLSAYETMC